MSDNEQNQQQPDATGPAAIDTDNAAAEPAAAGGGSSWWLFVPALLLALVAVAGSGWLYQQSRDFDARQSELTQQLDSMQSRLGELNHMQQQSRAGLETLEETQSTTAAALQKLAERDRWDNFDWALAEIEYLAIIAMQRLTLAREPQAAQAALEAASLRLKDIDDPALVPVRQQFAADINALRELPEVDVAGMALYLGDLITRAEKLPLKPDTPALLRDRDTGAEQQPVEGWRGVLNAIWQELRGLVVIQREDEPPPVLLSPDERYFLYQNLRVELASARQSVLRRDTRNLSASLELIEDWLVRYFDSDTAAVGNMLEAFDQMRTVELAPELPDISGSLESVRAYSRRRSEQE